MTTACTVKKSRFHAGHFFAVVFAVGGVLVGVTVAGVYRAAKHKPAFYQRALEMEPQQQEVASEQLEQNVLELHNSVRKPGHWEAQFTDEQINGWLGSDLKKKFPKLLPKGVQDPRVEIGENVAQVACRYDSPQLATVISLAVEIHLTDEPNVVAIRVCKARAGALPLPLKSFLDSISEVAAQSGLPLRWAQRDGDPVALFTIPSHHEDYVTQGIFLDTIEMKNGVITLAGHSGEAIEIHRTASLDQPNLNFQR